MIRLASIALVLAACGSCGGNKDKAEAPPAKDPGGEKVAVPGGGSGAPKGGAPGTATVGGSAPVDDPKLHIKPEEGSLDIGKAEGKAGAEATAKIEVKPATGYHVSVDFPTSLKLDAPDGVKLAKAEFTAGHGQAGDADKLTEQGLEMSVKATADKPGSYAIKGWFKFGVCDKESCHPKRQPIEIQVVAN
jgi:hypothetical protein